MSMEDLAIAVIQNAARELATTDDPAEQRLCMIFLEHCAETIFPMSKDDIMERIVKPILMGEEVTSRGYNPNDGVGAWIQVDRPTLERAIRLSSSQAEAADIAGCSSMTVRRKMDEWGIPKPDAWGSRGRPRSKNTDALDADPVTSWP